MNDDIPDLLHLTSIRVLRAPAPEDGLYRIEAEATGKTSVCPHCGSDRLYRHGIQEQLINDCPMHGRRVLIALRRQRWRCRGCGKSFMDVIADLDERRAMTRRLVDWIEARCLRQSFASLARDVGVDDKTIRAVFDDHLARLKRSVKFSTPEVLGIDEVKVIGQYRAVLTNVAALTLYDFLESRRKSSLLSYFRQLPEKQKIECVTMDMWSVYRQVVEATIPRAQIVVDKFHILRMANEAMEQVRKAIRRTLSTRQRLKLKNDRFVLLKRETALSAHERTLLATWTRDFPLLGLAWRAKEDFFAIWDTGSRLGAERAWARWKYRLPEPMEAPFAKLVHAVTSWHDPIFAYFDRPVTNAYTESINRLIKSLNRHGRGYSFEVLRARLLYDGQARLAGQLSVRAQHRQRTAGYTHMHYMDFLETAAQEPGPAISTLVTMFGAQEP